MNSIVRKHITILLLGLLTFIWLMPLAYVLQAQEETETLLTQEETQAEEEAEEEASEQVEEEPGEEAAQTLPDSAYILQRRRLNEEIDDQHAQLLGELSTYQENERKFRVAHDQYSRLQTLNSIEGVVAAAKTLIASRNTALNSYLNLLRLKLIESEGVEISHKNRALERVENLQLQLQNHSALLNDVNDREGINELNSIFSPLVEQISETSYYALSILTIGRLQAVYDQAIVINQKIKGDISDEQLALSNTRSRNLAEVDKLIANIPPLFQAAWADVAQAEVRNNGYSILYRGLSEKLNVIYARVSRLVSYFEELEGVR